MITWMQRHRKYLVVTIWISTIAFLGAGFVGWGQYDYGNKGGAIATIGEISITQDELQKNYEALFNQYNQLFGGKLDEKQAKALGLQRQALQSLVNQALIVNLADSYHIQVSDEQLLGLIKSQNVFTKNGTFDKETYTQVLRQNHLSIQEYEKAMRRELLIQKTLFLFSPTLNKLEKTSFAMGVSDTVAYKILTPNDIALAPDITALKSYWEKHKKEYKNPARYDISIIRSPIRPNLDESASEKEALRLYIAFKKGTLDTSIPVEKMTVTANSKQLTPEILKDISTLSEAKAFLKPRKIADAYVIIKLDKIFPQNIKTFEEASDQANVGYTYEAKKAKLTALAQESYKTFTATAKAVIVPNKKIPLAGLSTTEASEFSDTLFASKQKQGFITLESGNVILYNIVEQKLLQDTAEADNNTVMKLKGNVFNQKLLKTLENKYPIKIYAEGM